MSRQADMAVLRHQLKTTMLHCNCKQVDASKSRTRSSIKFQGLQGLQAFELRTRGTILCRSGGFTVFTMPPPRRPGPKSGMKKRGPATNTLVPATPSTASSPSPAAKSKRNHSGSADVEGDATKVATTKEEHFQVNHPSRQIHTAFLRHASSPNM